MFLAAVGRDVDKNMEVLTGEGMGTDDWLTL